MSLKFKKISNQFLLSAITLLIFSLALSLLPLGLSFDLELLKTVLTVFVVLLIPVNWLKIVSFYRTALPPGTKKRRYFFGLSVANVALMCLVIIGLALFKYGSPLIYEDSVDGFRKAREKWLINDELITQEFTADSDNLGTVSLKLAVREKTVRVREGAIEEVTIHPLSPDFDLTQEDLSWLKQNITDQLSFHFNDEIKVKVTALDQESENLEIIVADKAYQGVIEIIALEAVNDAQQAAQQAFSLASTAFPEHNLKPYEFNGLFHRGWRTRKQLATETGLPQIIDSAFFKLNKNVYQLELRAEPEAYEELRHDFEMILATLQTADEGQALAQADDIQTELDEAMVADIDDDFVIDTAQLDETAKIPALAKPIEIEFRIREKGTEEWLAVNRYYFDQVIPLGHYPFGFPVLPESEGKTYVIEIRAVEPQWLVEWEEFEADLEESKEFELEQEIQALGVSVETDRQEGLNYATRFVFRRGEIMENAGQIVRNFGRNVIGMVTDAKYWVNIIAVFVLLETVIYGLFFYKNHRLFKRFLDICFFISLFLSIIPQLLNSNDLNPSIVQIIITNSTILTLLFSALLIFINWNDIKLESLELHKARKVKKKNLLILSTIVVLIILGVYLRLNHIKHLSIWYDEGLSISVSQNIAKGKGRVTASGYPYGRAKLFHNYLSLFYRQREELWVGMYANIPFYIITSIFLYFFGKELKDKKIGLLTIFLFTFSWVSIAMAREVRFYEMFICFFTMANYFLYKSFKLFLRNKITINFIFYLLLSIIFFVISLQTQVLTFFVLYGLLTFSLILYLMSVKKGVVVFFFSTLCIILGNIIQYNRLKLAINYGGLGWVSEIYDKASALNFFIQLVKNDYFYIIFTLFFLCFLILKSKKIVAAYLFSIIISLYFLVSLQGVSHLPLLRFYYFFIPFILLATSYVVLLIWEKSKLLGIFCVLFLLIFSLNSGIRESFSPLTLASKYEHKNMPYQSIFKMLEQDNFKTYKIVGDHSFSLAYFLYNKKQIDYYLIRTNTNYTIAKEKGSGTIGITYYNLLNKIILGEKILFIYDQRNYHPINDELSLMYNSDQIIFESNISSNNKIYILKFN